MVHKLFILKLEPDLDPKFEKLFEHGPESYSTVILCGIMLLI